MIFAGKFLDAKAKVAKDAKKSAESFYLFCVLRALRAFASVHFETGWRSNIFATSP